MFTKWEADAVKDRGAGETERRRGDVRRLWSMLLLLVIGLGVLFSGTLVENGWVVLAGGFATLLGAGGLRLAAIMAVRDEAFSGLKHFVGRSRR
jgi:hypothetical protein